MRGMEEVRLPHANVRYRESGSGEPVVFLHGALVDGRLWRKVTPHLDGFRCIVPDLPLGAHRIPAAPGADLTPPGLARLVSDFLEALDLRDVTLVGNDTGGVIAQLVATRHPERLARLVLTPCDAFDNFLPRIFKPLTLGAKVPALLTAAVQPLRLRPVRRLPIAFGWLTKRPIEPRDVEDDWIKAFFADAAIRRDVVRLLRGVDKRITQQAAKDLERFDKPVLLAWATEDKVFPFAHAERFAAALPDARIERIEDSYAFVSEDQPQRTAQAITDFIRATPLVRAATTA
jgi:pimeloyl-ACP methyl ester carboxylesterase